MIAEGYGRFAEELEQAADSVIHDIRNALGAGMPVSMGDDPLGAPSMAYLQGISDFIHAIRTDHWQDGTTPELRALRHRWRQMFDGGDDG